MKQLFSIAIDHEYHRIDENTLGTTDDLSIVPASSNSIFVNNNRLWFRTRPGILDCYIEDDESLKSEVDVLFFWVVCKNEAFFSYTDYPSDINFSNPYYYWSNSGDRTALIERKFCALHPGKPPKMAIGCIGISLEELVDNTKFTIEFKTKKTFWTYHIVPKESQKSWKYRIEDTKEANEAANGFNNWVFKQEDQSDDGAIIFQSKDQLPYSKNATNRLKLFWNNENGDRFQDELQMVLPFANYAYKMVDEDNKELTPVYIYI